MNILWLSWRDIKNPTAGGAEKVAIEIVTRLAKDKQKVILFTSKFKGAKEQETINGVKIIRRGNLLTCRFFAFFYFLRNNNFDLVVDEINTLPFFSTFYSKKKTVSHIHQLAREYWWSETSFPLNLIGYLAEPIYMKLYRKTPTVTISKSTFGDLKKMGFDKITIIRAGIDFKPNIEAKKKNQIIFLGRLTKNKKPEDAITAFKKVKEKFPSYKLAIVGNGKDRYVNYLKELKKSLRIGKAIEFMGYVDDKIKIKFLSQSKIILIPSVREGWGLVATEAMSQGCVPVAYNVPGLKDAIKNNQTGVLTNPNPQSLADAAIKLLQDEKLRSSLAKNGYIYTQKFSWDNTYIDFKKVLEDKLSKAAR